jgi:hypothetical protein
MKIIKFIVGIALILVMILTNCRIYVGDRGEEDRKELREIKKDPSTIIFMDYFNIDFDIKPIATSQVTKYDSTNIFIYSKFDGFVESAEDAKIYLIYINENEMYILKKKVYYEFKLKGTRQQQAGQMQYIKMLYKKHLSQIKKSK